MAYKLLKQKYGKDITGIIMDYYEDNDKKKNQFLGVVIARYNARIERRKRLGEYMILDESVYLCKNSCPDVFGSVLYCESFHSRNYLDYIYYTTFIIKIHDWKKKEYMMLIKEIDKPLNEITNYEDCKKLFFEILFNSE